jgi:hypothetical protein
VSADGRFIDDFGRGAMHFGAFAAEQKNEIQGIYSASFINPQLSKAQDFTGKVYSLFGGTTDPRTGTAIFYFHGSYPVPPLSVMLQGLDAQTITDILNFLSREYNQAILQSNYDKIFLCPNPSVCDPNNPTFATCGPVLDSNSDGICEETRTHLESFSIEGVVPDLVFTIIANSQSAFFADVNANGASVLAALDSKLPAAGSAIAFGRAWDCLPEGSWSIIDPAQSVAGLTSAEIEAMKAKLQVCQAIETETASAGGIESYNCPDQQMTGDVQTGAK